MIHCNSPDGRGEPEQSLRSKRGSLLTVSTKSKGLSDEAACSAEHLYAGRAGRDSLSVSYLVCSAPQSFLSTHTLLRFMEEQGW